MAVSVSPTDNASVGGPVMVLAALVVANLLAWALNPHSWVFRRILGAKLGMPQLLFISNRADGVPHSARPTTYWTFDLLSPQHQVQSPLFSNTTCLLLLHAATFLYWVATVLVDTLVEYYGHGCTASWCWPRSGLYLEWMTFLTNWSICILGLASLVAFINTARFARQQRRTRKQHKQQQQANNHSQPGGSHSAAVPGQQALRVSGAGLPDAVVLPQLTRDQQHSNTQQQQQPKQQQQGAVGEPLSQPASSNTSGGSGSTSGSSCCGSCDTVVVVGLAAGGSASGGEQEDKPHLAKWDWLSKTHCILMQVATAAALFVSFWFWVGLVGIAGMPFRANGGTLMAHAGNFVLALLQLLLTRLPVVSTHFQALLLYSTVYQIFLVAYGAGSGTWRYGLDWQKLKPAGALMLVPLVAFIFFCFWFLLARGREAVFHRRQLHKAKKGTTAQHDGDRAAGAAAGSAGVTAV